MITIDDIFKDKVEKSYPCARINKALYPTSGSKGEVFIYGKGYKKFRKEITIPPIGDFITIKTMNDYLQEYGEECLVFALTGKTYSYHKQKIAGLGEGIDDILALLKLGNDYVTMMDNVIFINNEIDKLLDRTSFDHRWMIDGMGLNPYGKLRIRISHRIYGFRVGAMMQAVEDDIKLEVMYKVSRIKELVERDDYYKDLDRGWFNRIGKEWEGDYNNADEMYSHLHRKMNDIISKTSKVADKEMEEGIVFPICMRDRMTMLLGEDASRRYKQNLNICKKG